MYTETSRTETWEDLRAAWTNGNRRDVATSIMAMGQKDLLIVMLEAAEELDMKDYGSEYHYHNLKTLREILGYVYRHYLSEMGE